MEVRGRFGATYEYIEFNDIDNNDRLYLGEFYNQFVDWDIAFILECVKSRSDYVYCKEQPIFKNGGFGFNLVRSPYYDACMDFIVEAFPEHGEGWDYDYILSDMIKSLMCLQEPDSELFMMNSQKKSYIEEILYGMCTSLMEFCGDDYGCYLSEVVSYFAHVITKRASQRHCGNRPLETAMQTF